MGIARRTAGTSRESFALISENPSSYPKISGISAQIAIFGTWHVRDTDISGGEGITPPVFRPQMPYMGPNKGAVRAEYLGGCF